MANFMLRRKGTRFLNYDIVRNILCIGNGKYTGRVFNFQSFSHFGFQFVLSEALDSGPKSALKFQEFNLSLFLESERKNHVYSLLSANCQMK